MAATPVKLRREEWDFRASWKSDDPKMHGQWEFLPPEEVNFALIYEEARHSGAADVWSEERQKAASRGVDIQKFEELLEDYVKTNPFGRDTGTIQVDWFYAIWPEWPAQPYLAIPRSVRKDRTSKCWTERLDKNGKPVARIPQLRLIELCQIYRIINAWKPTRSISPFRTLGPFTKVKPDDDVWILEREHGGSSSTSELAAFLIDFDLPDNVLTWLFANWLKERRDQKGYKHHENRGPASDTERMRKRLLAIGAGRLVHSGMSYEEAANYTKSISGKPLYLFPSAWSRAVKVAAEILGQPPSD